MFWKRKKPKVPFELVNEWQQAILASLGVSSEDSNEVIKESCRRVLLETGLFYNNIIRIEDGMKPIK